MSGTVRSHCSSASNGVGAGSNGTEKNSPYRRLEPAGQRASGTLNVLGESQEKRTQASRTSPGALLQGSSFETGNIQAVTQSGPPRHQKLPSLSDILDNRTDGGNLATAHLWEPCSQPGRSAMPCEQTVAGGSPVSTASGYALSGSETDGLPIQFLLSGNEPHSTHKDAHSLPNQPILEYAAYR